MANLLKVHGSENQFFILDQTTLHQKLNDNELKQLAQTIADPENNVLNGADGLLMVDSSNHPGALGKMRVFNADGSEASMCGNGLRTVSRYLAQKFNQTHFKVETNDADLDVQREADIAEGVPAFSVQISPISFDSKSLPLENLKTPLIDQPVDDFISGLEYSAVAVPNPHLISFMGMDQVKSDDLVHLGTMLNKKIHTLPTAST
ncbi:diaminopimelate epimerase [Fructilactobacillus fructivorans]|nr:diaminopimelate epimerase [Fructilactobacillus fructivorans]